MTASTPAQIAELVTNVAHTAFTSGMNAAFGVAALVALAGAAIALLTRRGGGAEDGTVI